MQKARRHHICGSDRLWAHGFRYSFTPLLGVLFTFPSRYLCAIGLPGVLSLGGWCRLLRTGLLRPRPTQGTGWVGAHFRYGAVTRSGPPSQACSAVLASSLAPALQPRRRLDADGLGWPPFARRYSGGHCCFPFLRLLGCFGSSGWPPPTGGCRASARRVAPFGCPRIHGCSRLPAAFRGLPRPSSPPGATGIPRAPSLARSPPRLPARGPLASGLGPMPAPALVSFFFFVSRCSCVSRVPAPPLASRRDGGCASLVFPSLSHPVNEPSRPPGPLLWRMWGSNPRPPACKAGALAD